MTAASPPFFLGIAVNGLAAKCPVSVPLGTRGDCVIPNAFIQMSYPERGFNAFKNLVISKFSIL